jgi:glycosyltransferase involved in cell wall biosynthesis
MVELNIKHPRVSIGIPVYNGENYLEYAINSLLQQSFKDFEIIISDNASTDKTEEICQSFQSQDGRIRYYRNPINLGAASNYKKVFQLARGEFFKWMAHDDMCSSNYLEECVRVLEADLSVVMSFPRVSLIDKDNKPLPLIAENTYQTSEGKIILINQQLNFRSSSPSERYSEVLFRVTECYEFFGLSRTDIIKRTSQHDAYYGSDKVLLTELSLMGKLQEVPNAIGYFRLHAEQSQSIRDAKERASWISPNLNYGKFTSRFKCVQGYYRSIFTYPLSLSERFKCLWILISWLIDWNNWWELVKEIFNISTKQHKKSIA